MTDTTDTTKRPGVASVLRRYRDPFHRRWPSLETAAPTSQANRIVGLLSHCRQGPLGCHAYYCDDCQDRHVRMNSCGNRHCPTCGCRRRWEWRERVIGWSLDCDYLHDVFTLPHELNPLMRCNQAVLYRLLMRCSIDTLDDLAAKEYGCQIGMVVTLHTWGQQLKQHVHAHVVMNRRRQIFGRPTLGSDHSRRSGDARARVGRRLQEDVPEAAEDALQAGEARLSGRGFQQAGRQDRAEAVGGRCGSHARKVPGRRGDHQLPGRLRLRSGDQRREDDLGRRSNVTFRYKDYNTGEAKELTILGEEFVNPFALHVLPYRLQRLRYAGMFQSRGREERLAECRRLIEEAGLARKPTEDDEPAGSDNEDRPLEADEAPPKKVEQRCKCGAEMPRLGRLGGVVTMRLLSRVTMLAAVLAAGADELILDRLRDELLPPSTSQ